MTDPIRVFYECAPGTPSARGFRVFVDSGPDRVLVYGPYRDQRDAEAVRARLQQQLAREGVLPVPGAAAQEG
jgi:hypothetical protein